VSSLRWIHESPAYWDTAKVRIVGGAPAGVFDLRPPGEGELVPGDWWRVEDQGAVVGYGWLELTWGDAEILLAVAPDRRGRGIGSFILENLENEAQTQGLNYLCNIVRPNHPEKMAVTRWLRERRFEEAEDGYLRRRVKTSRGENP
jgi:N-acetylglutamate synthase-like GNAT family acetyltransferase